jgi:hypothetical protein
MSRHSKTVRLIQTAREILAEHHPMTVRQVYYQLVSRQVIENNLGRYNAVCNALRDARREGLIPWEWIEDRLRVPRHVAMWNGLPDFADTCLRSYRRNVWKTQTVRIEAWVEKDALSGIFEDTLKPYGVTLNVGRGYDGWTSIHNAARRLRGNAVILYFGDFDPSGEDMVHSLRERLADQGAEPRIIKCALTPEDIERYDLPPALTKKSDTRAAKFIAEHGDVSSVELDALPLEVLRARIVEEVEARMDLDALEDVRLDEEQDREKLVKALVD